MDTESSTEPGPGNRALRQDEVLRRAVADGHETADVNVRGLFIFAFALVVSVFVILAGLVAVFGAFGFFDRKLDAHRARREPAAASLVRVAPDYQGPLLQAKPEEDLSAMRVRNARDLQTYAWLDRPAGVVRLPVERAIDLLAQRGLPPISAGKTLEGLQRERAQPQVFGQSLRP